MNRPNGSNTSSSVMTWKSSMTRTTGAGRSASCTQSSSTSASPNWLTGFRYRNGLRSRTAPLATNADTRFDQNDLGLLSESSKLNQATGPRADDAVHDAAVMVFPQPGPALTRVSR